MLFVTIGVYMHLIKVRKHELLTAKALLVFVIACGFEYA